jgi:hypothetical protein
MNLQSEFELICPTFRPELAAGLVESVDPVEVTLVDGIGAKSFAGLCNSAIGQSESKFVIIANDKSRPTSRDVAKTVALLEAGFGLVGLYRMGFFGVQKEVLDYIGGFDELFSDGGYEDNDLYLRLKFCDIGVYLSEEIDYLSGYPSSWTQAQSRRHFFQKYNFGLFSKAIFADLARLKPEAHRVRPSGLKGWGESVFGVIPLETKKSRFESFLRDGWFVDTAVRDAPRIQLKRIAKGLVNVFRNNAPPVLEWNRFRVGQRPD